MKYNKDDVHVDEKGDYIFRYSNESKRVKKIYLNVIRLNKKEYGSLCHEIDSYPSKWKSGYNSITLNGKFYIFKYYGYNDYDIVYKGDAI